jgi:hypothetical protein
VASAPSRSAGAVTAIVGAGCCSDSGSCPSDATSVHAVWPFSQVWMVGNTSVSPGVSGTWKDSSKASR